MTRPKLSKKFVAGRGYTREDWDTVSDNPPLTKAELKKARPFSEVFPDLAASARRGRGKQKAPTKMLVTLRLNRITVEAFKATGPGWQTRLDEALKTVKPSRSVTAARKAAGGTGRLQA